MLRVLSSAAFAAAIASLAALVSCGDLVIPSNAGDDASPDDGGGALDDGPIDGRVQPDCDAGTHPFSLACTGLYSDWAGLAVAPDVRAYAPGAEMWTDGAAATRWIWLPPASRIDTSTPSAWTFPVGTKVWQEVRLLGKRIETRFSWKLAPSLWFRSTYAWSEDETSANELVAGLPNARGLPYEIPAASACEKCHGGASDFVLGFEEVSLALPKATGLHLAALVQQGMLTSPPSALPVVPGDAATASVLSFLHANCGTSCHNRGPGAQAGSTGLFLALVVDAKGALPASARQTDAWTTAYQVPSRFAPGGQTGDAGGWWRIAPGDVAHSTLAWRASRRDGTTQMPPIATHRVDQDDMKMLSDWIAALP